jgi:glycosyltransferase
MACFENDPELDILYGNLVYVKSDDLNKVVRKWKSCPSYTNFFENGNVPPHPTLFVRSQVYQIAGLFDLEYKLAADYEFMLRIFKKHNFKSYYLNRSMVKMRLGGATNKNYKNIISGNKEILLSWKKNGLNIPFRLIPLKIIKRLNQFI